MREECCSLTPPPPPLGVLTGRGLVGVGVGGGGAQCMLELGTASAGDQRACDEARGWKNHRPRLRWGPSFSPVSLGQAELPSLTLSSSLIWNLLRPLLFYPSLSLYRLRDLIRVRVTSSLSQQPAAAETQELALLGAVSPYLGAGDSQYPPL